MAPREVRAPTRSRRPSAGSRAVRLSRAFAGWPSELGDNGRVTSPDTGLPLHRSDSGVRSHRDQPGLGADASSDTAGPTGLARELASQVSAQDLQVVAEQLGRTPRGVVAIAARCVCGRPTVVRTAPRLPDGTPFPTTYYLTHPAAVAAVSTLEAEGLMAELTDRLAGDPDLAAAHRAAHEDYLRARDELGIVPEIAGISAGGMPSRVKCLHVLVGHALARGRGVNPIGDLALDLIADTWRPDRCTC